MKLISGSKWSLTQHMEAGERPKKEGELHSLASFGSQTIFLCSQPRHDANMQPRGVLKRGNPLAEDKTHLNTCEHHKKPEGVFSMNPFLFLQFALPASTQDHSQVSNHQKLRISYTPPWCYWFGRGTGGRSRRYVGRCLHHCEVCEGDPDTTVHPICRICWSCRSASDTHDLRWVFWTNGHAKDDLFRAFFSRSEPTVDNGSGI